MQSYFSGLIVVPLGGYDIQPSLDNDISEATMLEWEDELTKGSCYSKRVRGVKIWKAMFLETSSVRILFDGPTVAGDIVARPGRTASRITA